MTEAMKAACIALGGSAILAALGTVIAARLAIVRLQTYRRADEHSAAERELREKERRLEDQDWRRRFEDLLLNGKSPFVLKETASLVVARIDSDIARVVSQGDAHQTLIREHGERMANHEQRIVFVETRRT